MIPTAVVIREDTGMILAREGNQLADQSLVKCDFCGSEVKIDNAFLIEEKFTGNQRFDGSILSPEAYGTDKHYFVAYFFLDKKGSRVAKYHYYFKDPRNKPKAGDPYCLTVVNGKKFIERIKAA